MYSGLAAIHCSPNAQQHACDICSQHLLPFVCASASRLRDKHMHPGCLARPTADSIRHSQYELPGRQVLRKIQKDTERHRKIRIRRASLIDMIRVPGMILVRVCDYQISSKSSLTFTLKQKVLQGSPVFVTRCSECDATAWRYPR